MSSVGIAAALLAKQRNMTVLSTTRSANKTATLTDIGVDHVLIQTLDSIAVKPWVRASAPGRRRLRRGAD
jgi:NADPH:quinone reductase